MESINNKGSLETIRIVELYKGFFCYLRSDIYKIILNIIVISCVIFIGAIIIWMVGQGLDALGQTNFSVLPSYLLGFLAFVVLLQVLRYLNYYLIEWMQQRIINSVRRKMYQHLLTLGVPFKDKYAAGELLTRLSQDVVRVSEFLVLMPSHIFTYGFTLVFYFGILFYIDPWLTLLTVLLAPLIFFHQRIFIGKTRKAAHDFLTCQGSMGAFEEESIRNIQGVVTFTATRVMTNRFDNLFFTFRRAAMKNLLLNNAFVVSFELLIAIAAILLVAAGVYRIEHTALTAGGLVNFLLYLGYMSVPLRGLANVPIESQVRAVATQRVKEILDQQPEICDKSTAINLSQISSAINFNNVDFKYHEKIPTLQNLSLNICAGEFIAIMGESGVGKSTLAKLLLRFYDPVKGSIYIDGIDIRDISLESLRSHIAVVWQEPFLIDGTIYDNLMLCKADATEIEMKKALQDAYAYDFIQKLPQGDKTYLGKNGTQLSSGQKQRIAIAQALLKKASILILDEATSALDSKSESAVQKALNKLHGKCTVIVIAHRLSTIINSDRVIYINNDGTVETGSCFELHKKHNQFREMIAHQTQTTESMV